MEVRDDVLKSLETARKEKLIGAPLEARVRLSANGELCAAARTVRGRTARAVHRVAGGTGAARQAMSLALQVERAAGRQVRALLEVHHRRRLERRSFPTICGGCAGGRATRF